MCEKANQTNGVFFTEKEIPPGEKPDAVIAFFLWGYKKLRY